MQAKPVATVHDSIEIVCPKEEVKDTLAILYDEMVNYPKLKDIFNIHFDVPMAIDAEVGKSFGDGKEVHFDNGIPIL